MASIMTSAYPARHGAYWVDRRIDPTVLQPMLEEVRSGNMEPEVLRVALHSMAKAHRQREVADQLFLRPAWTGFESRSETVTLPSSTSMRASSRRSAAP